MFTNCGYISIIFEWRENVRWDNVKQLLFLFLFIPRYLRVLQEYFGDIYVHFERLEPWSIFLIGGWKNNQLGSCSCFGVGSLHVLETLSVCIFGVSTSSLEIVQTLALGPCEWPRVKVGLYGHTWYFLKGIAYGTSNEIKALSCKENDISQERQAETHDKFHSSHSNFLNFITRT